MFELKFRTYLSAVGGKFKIISPPSDNRVHNIQSLPSLENTKYQPKPHILHNFFSIISMDSSHEIFDSADNYNKGAEVGASSLYKTGVLVE